MLIIVINSLPQNQVADLITSRFSFEIFIRITVKFHKHVRNDHDSDHHDHGVDNSEQGQRESKEGEQLKKVKNCFTKMIRIQA